MPFPCSIGIEMISKKKKNPEEKKYFLLSTVPAPLKGAPFIQKLFFGLLDYHIKNKLKLAFSMIS